MKVRILDEPELEFAGGGRHIDPRFGIVDYGPADLGSGRAPTAIRVGLVGDSESIAGIREWLESCRSQLAAKESALPHLFIGFPGFERDVAFRSELVFDTRFERVISERTLRTLKEKTATLAVEEAVQIYAGELRTLFDDTNCDVAICARPDVLNELEQADAGAEDDQAASQASGSTADPGFDFHDRLKALLMRGRPIQLLRRDTWDPTPRARRAGAVKKLPVQDAATRAWNLHTALYYKAGGVPWRLRRDASDLASCFVGISFYRSQDRTRLHTSVAQVFNERGDGVIVRGGTAAVSKEDRQPHLNRADAETLLRQALDRYRAEHKTAPARLVIHKSSAYSPGELEGFRAAADGAQLEVLEMLWLGDADSTRLYRDGDHPPLRGTLLSLGDERHVLYTRGSVDFFRAYPGMYVPTPLAVRLASTENAPYALAAEILALTKMNWNQTQFDGRLPITLRAARQVGHILRFVEEGGVVAASYAHYM